MRQEDCEIYDANWAVPLERLRSDVGVIDNLQNQEQARDGES